MNALLQYPDLSYLHCVLSEPCPVAGRETDWAAQRVLGWWIWCFPGSDLPCLYCVDRKSYLDFGRESDKPPQTVFSIKLR